MNLLFWMKNSKHVVDELMVTEKIIIESLHTGSGIEIN